MSLNRVMLQSLRASIFLDHENIYKHIQKRKNKEEFKNHVINYREFRKLLLQDFTSAGVFAFLGVSDPLPPEKEIFINYLKMSGFTVFSRKLEIKRNGKLVQKGVDVLMSLHIENLIPAFDMAILIAGDSDYTVIVEMLKNSNKFVQIWSWKESMSKTLLKTVGKENVFYINSIWDKIKRKRKQKDS